MACLKLESIQKVYPGGAQAVKDFNLEIADKEFVVFVGPSGCGKSTTLRMIAGLESISGGNLYIGDRLVNNISPKDRDIAMVFQNYALYPHMTVYDNIAYGLKVRRTPKDAIHRRVMEVAEQLEITEYLGRKPKAMSGGQRQRVALGRAMVRNPSVFPLDEPLSNLDAKLRASMRIEIMGLHKRLETTFIYVTHDQTEAMTMADRIVIMKGGLIQQIDTPQNLYLHPANQFVAGFIGMPQMNFFPAMVHQRDGAYCAEIAENTVALPPCADYAAYLGREVILGIRPEHVWINGDPHGIETQLVLHELMGAETYLHLEFSGQKLVCRTAEMDCAKGSFSITFNIARILLFDKNTGRTIGLAEKG
ncbi:sn-glycerol-3-phosphate ABC transporter ATP-binding protein UgpC [Oscillospiraceae bacterium MB08-C2-2]|nr:sn-glycerol-3-phosphate ABC transporter ATP-binding protein UgpC [Oscillospiraceae bacterium MB08-C2-2]